MKNMIVTGAAGNLGRAVTEKFLTEGYRVHAIIAPDDDPGFMDNELLKVYRGNLMDETDAGSVAGKITEAAGRIDIAVLTVGGFALGGLTDTSVEDLEKMYRLNFVTAFNVARPLFEHMEEKGSGGQFVFIGARPGLEAGEAKNMVAYALSKSLLFRLSEVINHAGKKHGITSTVVAPGTIDTHRNRKAMPDADPSGWVTPQAIAGNIFHLVTPSGRVLRETILKAYNEA